MFLSYPELPALCCEAPRQRSIRDVMNLCLPLLSSALHQDLALIELFLECSMRQNLLCQSLIFLATSQCLSESLFSEERVADSFSTSLSACSAAEWGEEPGS